MQRPSSTQAGDLNDHWALWSRQAAERAADGWPAMIDDLAGFQDAVAASVPPADVVAEVRDLLARATGLLSPHGVQDDGQIFGRLLDLPSRGQCLVPAVHTIGWGDDAFDGWTQFGPFHSGHNGTVHGGAIANLFDDVLGRTADLGGRPRSRTAYLHLDFRSVTPLGRRLSVHARVGEQSGRKRFLHGTLHDGDRLCVEASALFLEMLEGQP